MRTSEKSCRFNPHGPAVQLGTSTSLFPLHLAAVWRSKGLEVDIVARDAVKDTILTNGARIHSVRQRCGFLFNKITKNYRYLNPLEELIAQAFKGSYKRRTGQDHILPGQAYFIDALFEALPTAKVARSLKPRFVFGHDAISYGLATALCKGIPRILFPWGSEIFAGAETSPILYHLVKHSLASADLILPSSETAAVHIASRFNVPPGRVEAISWGVDTSLFTRAGNDRRIKICQRYRIEPSKIIITNPRRFRPTWGCFVALESFLRLAKEHANVHFIMLGGLGTEEFVKEGKSIVEAEGFSDRFTLLEGDIPLEEFSDIMSVSEIFVSLLGLGDMRSWSVLQGVAAGAVPVISKNREYIQMGNRGFSGIFVRHDSSNDVYEGLKSLISNPGKLTEMRRSNEIYVSSYEDHDKQMGKMLKSIDEVCTRYERTFID